MSSATLLLLGLCLCFQLPHQSNTQWILDLAKNNILRVKNLKDAFLFAPENTTTGTQKSAKSLSSPVTGRDYGGGGMGFPSLETSLTTLAFLSFGAFLLSMMMKALNITSGRRRRDLSFSRDDSGYDVYEFSEAARLALDALNSAIFDRDLPSCEARALCRVFSSTRREGGFTAVAPVLTNVALNWIREIRPGLISPSKWKMIRKICTTNKCDEQFPDCDDARFVNRGGGKMRAISEKRKRWPGIWLDDEKSTRFKMTTKWPWTNIHERPTKTNGR